MIGDLINCMARTYDGRCQRCAVCRIVLAIEGLQEPDQLAVVVRHLDRIADQHEALVDIVEESR